MKLSKIIGHGRTADVYLYKKDTVVKLFKEHFSNEEADKEEKLHTIAQGCGLPVPKLLDTIMVNGRKGLVYQRIDGSTMLTLMGNHPQKVMDFAHDAACLHRDILSCKVDTNMVSIHDKYANWIKKLTLLTDSEKQFALDVLSNLDEDHRLCHGDFHPDNILVTDDGQYYIIDWLTATKGSSYADIMRSSILVTYGAASEDLHLSEDVRRCIECYHSTYLGHLCKLCEINIKDIYQWEVPSLAARLHEGVHISEKQLILKKLRSILS